MNIIRDYIANVINNLFNKRVIKYMVGYNICKKEITIFDLVKNDIPIPEEYRNMNYEDLLEGIRRNEIPVVYLAFKYANVQPIFNNEDLNFTLYWPGKEPIEYEYTGDWHTSLIRNLERYGNKAKEEQYPVLVNNRSHTLHALYEVRKPYRLSKKKTCVWCGEMTDTPVYHQDGKFNRVKGFCSDSDCKKKYKRFQYQLRNLVKEGKIDDFEKEWRSNPVYSVIDDTWNNSYLLGREIIDCYSPEELEELPLITDNKFFLINDNNVVFADRTCKNCGHLMYGNKQAKFCSDKCRYDYHNKMKKLRH